MKITLNSSKLLKRLNNLKNVPKSYMEQLKVRVEKNTPIDTGLLKDSWMLDDLVLYNTQPYSNYVEYGTRNQQGAFMLTKSLLESYPDFKKSIKFWWSRV